MSHGPDEATPYSWVLYKINAMLTQKVPKKKLSCGWCKLVDSEPRFVWVNRYVMHAQKVRNKTKSRMKNALPIVLRPVKLNGCWPSTVAIAPVDIVHSNHAQVK
jgi:hypothetical protein